MYQITLLISLSLIFNLLSLNASSVNERPIIETKLGKIQGQYKLSFNKNPYAAYEGIRYAQPPLGKRRFKEPEMVRPWNGTWDATNLHQCLQCDMSSPEKVSGEEDCLFLNVYVPKRSPESGTFSALVDIHGGAFMYGSNHQYASPEYLMDRPIILITINYRLNLFGFLSTEDKLVPGNNGLKDQVMALRWIQENIASFAGDPKSVTIMGYSAGGASVQYHLIAPMSKGLFARAISQGGSPLNPWALQKTPMVYTKKLAEKVGCLLETNRKMINCLKRRPAAHLTKHYPEFFQYAFFPLAPFGPVVEKKTDNTFLDVQPYVALRKGQVTDVPVLTSNTANEGLYIIQHTRNLIEDLNERWTELAPLVLNYDPDSSRNLAKFIKEFYLGDGDKFNISSLDKMFTHRYSYNDAEISIRYIAKHNKSPVYYYLFSFLDDNNFNGGVPHMHDVQYFFTTKYFNNTEPSAEGLEMKDFMIDLIVGFANTGAPKIESVNWEPTTFDTFKLLNITSLEPEGLQMKTVEELGPRVFWETLNLMENQHLAVAKDEL